MKSIITLKDVGFRVDDKVILENVDFSLNDDEIITVVGPNGAGKSTLLSLILGLKKPSTGRIHVDSGLRIGYVPQFINRDYTIPITVADFVKLTKSTVADQTMTELFDELALMPLANSLLSHLSGGELRRVLLARALLNDPDVLILDEPTAGVDVAEQSAFYRRLGDWKAQKHFSILMVSHDLHLVMASTDRVICLNKHICCQGKPISVINDKKYIALFGHSHLHEESEFSFYRHHSAPQQSQ